MTVCISFIFCIRHLQLLGSHFKPFNFDLLLFQSYIQSVFTAWSGHSYLLFQFPHMPQHKSFTTSCLWNVGRYVQEVTSFEVSIWAHNAHCCEFRNHVCSRLGNMVQDGVIIKSPVPPLSLYCTEMEHLKPFWISVIHGSEQKKNKFDSQHEHRYGTLKKLHTGPLKLLISY